MANDERNYYVICDDHCLFPAMTAEQVLEAIAEATGTTPTPVDDAFITKIKEGNHNASLTFWQGTEAEFIALGVTAAAYKVLVDADKKVYLIPDDGSETIELPLSIANGGTGADTAAGARENLGITPANIGAAASNHTHTPASIGAAAENHNHDSMYYTESEVDTMLSGKAASEHTHDSTTVDSISGDLLEWALATPQYTTRKGYIATTGVTNTPITGAFAEVSRGSAVYDINVYGRIGQVFYNSYSAGSWGSWRRVLTNRLLPDDYGTTLPASGTTGQIFFKKA